MPQRFLNELATNALVDRRTALKTLASTGAGLLALASSPATAANAASPYKEDASTGQLAAILPDFTADSRAKLQAVLTAPTFSGQIPAPVVQQIAASEKKTVPAVMIALLPLARTFSHPPISNYRVGAVAQGSSGNLYLGFNIEFPGHALGFAVHGEQSALSSAYMHAEPGVTSIALTAAPCGHCRQFMNELTPDGSIEILVDKAAPMKLAALLPLAFGPKDLGRKDGAFPIKPTNLIRAEQQPGQAAATSNSRASLAVSAPAPAADALSIAALEAAQTSYAPYTESHSGAAIATRSGRIYQGSYIENVAFNPSLSPLQTALVQLILAGDDYASITRVALAEIFTAKISQQSATEVVLTAVAPAVKLELIAAKPA